MTLGFYENIHTARIMAVLFNEPLRRVEYHSWQVAQADEGSRFSYLLSGGTTNGNGGTPDGNGFFAPILSTDSVLSDSVSLSWTGIQDAADGRTYKLRYKTKPPST